MAPKRRDGPLAGLRAIEMAGLGPLRMCGMLLSDLGAQVLVIDRQTPSGLGLNVERRFSILQRNRETIEVDLKTAAGIDLILKLAAGADALIEAFRPGTMERLGLGPQECLARNEKLVYGRLTGWGQDGPLAKAAGHDLNYIALSGVLHQLGRSGQPPTPPLNLLGDYGGGALYLAFGVVSALLSVARSGMGQVVDAAMVEGSASLMTSFYGTHAAGMFRAPRGENLVDSGSFFYEVYECADGKFVSVAAVEDKFFLELLRLIAIDPTDFVDRQNPASWQKGKAILAKKFKERTRNDWCALLEGTDACFAPVLSLEEAPRHPHNIERASFIEVDGIVQPAPAPRFSGTPASVPTSPHDPDADALLDWGFTSDEIGRLKDAGTVS